MADTDTPRPTEMPKLQFYGGLLGAVFPFIFFVVAVIVVALSGSPDERGFWPILIAALALSLMLARNRGAFCQILIDGMSKPILMIMIMAWVLASIIGVVMNATGFVEALTWLAGRLQLGGLEFIVATFLICAVVSTSTGTSFGTILICGPILYPAGGVLGADLATLAGAILGGATFGDNISPISDTTIASALSQKADIGGVVRSRLKYVVPAAILALMAYVVSALLAGSSSLSRDFQFEGGPSGLPMILVPLVVIFLLLRGHHLLEGLLFGMVTAIVVGLLFGLLQTDQLYVLDPENFTAKSLVNDGITRAVGISMFTIFLMGLVAGLEASGVLERLVQFSARHAQTVRSAEIWIVGVVLGGVMLTCHAVVAILTAGDFARETGERLGIDRYRRANLLDVAISTVTYIFPYFIPVILVAGITAHGQEYGVPTVSPLAIGLHNFHSWALLIVLVFALGTGYGRGQVSSSKQKLP